MIIDMEENVESIVREYSGTVYKIAISILMNKEDAENAFQEVFIKLYNKAPKFENETHRKAWIIRVTVNMCKDILNKKKNSKEEEIYEEIPMLEKESDDTFEKVMQLKEKYKIVIYLYYYEGYQIFEISKILDTNESTIKSQLVKARELLKNMLKEDF